jgi:large subunit ribosomal protein L5
MTQIKKIYKKIIRPDILLKNKYKNIINIPKINKIIVNIAINSKNKIIEPLIALEIITGQKAIIIKAKKSISIFNLRKNMYIASKITLQNNNMYSFLYKIIYIILPRIREFKGLSLKTMDKKGNYMMSINNILLFPEIEYQYDVFNNNYGMNISILTTATNNIEAKLLLSALQLPYKQ